MFVEPVRVCLQRIALNLNAVACARTSGISLDVFCSTDFTHFWWDGNNTCESGLQKPHQQSREKEKHRSLPTAPYLVSEFLLR